MEIRSISPDEYPAFQRTFMQAMGFGPPSDEHIERWAPVFLPARSVAALDRGQIVGTAYSYDFELTVPGGSQIAAAGVTAVGVLPTHRRRGLLTEIMRKQLTEARDRGEPVAILVASEAVIYGRFGYGASSFLFDYEIDRRDAAFAEPFEPTRLTLVDEETADKVFPELHERWRKAQPGAIPRSEVWWASMRADTKPGTESLLVHEDESGAADGFARYAKNTKWENGLPAGTVDVRDVITTSPEAAKSLWRHMLDVDLVRTIRVPARPVDEPLRWWIANPRALRVTRSGDMFWTRLLDVPASLGARSYRSDVDLVLDIEDPMFDENSARFELSARGGDVSCEKTSKSADLAMKIDALGSLYLGGVAASDLASGGRILELSDGALEKADAAFSSAPKPWSSTWF